MRRRDGERTEKEEEEEEEIQGSKKGERAGSKKQSSWKIGAAHSPPSQFFLTT